ncbi:NAD(P)-dependent dehydrogenase (short-subunit alcohol dehydrogenase family) [Rhodoferax ferrireducens]|uniref:NAD(P)-dependent dehydrogenase (Short-subunit alcohol dehydrogenase family) n=1 Tax=Rhodoferax ferrireducens TaxID=192843 RepID=A0ABU2CAG9_9BURK|nr:SDR family NAD(P)-dependent oxidoreductase [Rhodoferax ferrireducens]MDR7378301.1 NAD(P)-dependent dehydrogenase (short-subunit alcohol dehydrogenase family) [Rhodoferax ferrireducens]
MPNTTPQHLSILTGASRGMGLAMAEQLLQAGHRLVCISRQTNQQLAANYGALLEQWQHDLGDAAPVATRLGQWLRQQDAAQWASVTLINNAGILARLTPLRDAEAVDLAQALRVGLEAPMQLTAAFLDATRRWPGQRRVLNISSGLGRRAMAASAAYCAAKAGMDHFSRCVALDEAPQPNGAKICSLAPGVIDTDMQAQLRGADSAAFADQEAFANLHRSGQLTSPSDAAARVLAYLAQPDFGSQPVADVRG